MALLATALGLPSLSLAATKTVRYRGYALRVPATWPVFHLGRQSRVCVRFNRHAVYLGLPGAAQRCPAQAVGHSEAILVEPTSARTATAKQKLGPALPAATTASASGNTAQFAVPSHGVTVTATWARHPQVIEHALRARSLSALRRRSAAAASAAAAASKPRAMAAEAVYTGLGFDVCSTPSTSTMSAWGASPYRAVGVYIGGANMACSQANLTAQWAYQETSAGWHLILIYVGLQAPNNSCGCASISPGSATAEGEAAAIDAVDHAEAVGVGPGNPIYDDMESYSHTSSNTSAVLNFLSGWTNQLHADGFKSGVYSSTGSGITDLVSQYGTGYSEPDDLWIAHWNGEQTTSDPSVPSSEWASHQRIHQYDGGTNETWGGYTLNVDHDYVDAATAGASCVAEFPEGTFVQVPGSDAIYRIAGGAPLFVSDWSTVGGEQPVTVISSTQFGSLCPVPQNGTFLTSSTGAVYRVAGGAPLFISNWSLFGGVQPSVQIDQWDITNAGNPAAHLNAVPSNGTVVEGLPSQKYWTFQGGRRMFGGAASRAVAVDDAGLARFPTVPCVAPKLKHLTFPNVKKAISKADCRLGKVHRPKHWPRNHKLRAVWQIPKPGKRHSAGWKVGVQLK